MDHPRPLLCIFGLFKQTSIQFSPQITVKIIWYWESNSRPSEHESPPITTGAGLIFKPTLANFLCNGHFFIVVHGQIMKQ